MNKTNLPNIISFDWDSSNLHKNRLKHQVESSECEQVFFDQPIYLYDQVHSQTESRFRALGLTSNNRLLFISFTLRQSKIRIISARDPNKKERANYLKEVNQLEET